MLTLIRGDGCAVRGEHERRGSGRERGMPRYSRMWSQPGHVKERLGRYCVYTEESWVACAKRRVYQPEVGGGHPCAEVGGGHPCAEVGGGHPCAEVSGGHPCAEVGGGHPCAEVGGGAWTSVTQLGRSVVTAVGSISLSLVLTFGVVNVPVSVVRPEPAHAVTNEQLLYLEAWRAVDRAYVDKQFNGQSWFRVREDTIRKKKLVTREDTYNEIRSMLALLDDPFTRFLEPEQLKALKGSTSGDVTGVGLEVSYSANTKNDKNLVVIAPSPGGPAERAGIRAGDEVVSIDGRLTSSMSLYAAGNALQGAEGSEVTLKIERPGVFSSTKDITLKREKISVQVVDAGLCSTKDSKKIGYIRIATFSKKTSDKVREAIINLRKAGVEQFILDVRNNGGGVFAAGVDVAKMWIESGDIVLIADSDGVRDVYAADGSALDTATPLAVLVNKGTASASEVLAGALKDNNRAMIVGENTFGKGLIQTLVELSDGSAVTVTVSKYQTPAGIDINKTGIDPQKRLSAEELEEIPLGSKGFCSYIEKTDSSVVTV